MLLASEIAVLSIIDEFNSVTLETIAGYMFCSTDELIPILNKLENENIIFNENGKWTETKNQK